MTSDMTPEQKTLREAVARAMCIAHGDDPDQMIDTLLHDGPQPCWDFYYGHFADAAIAVALERAAKELDGWGDIYGRAAAAAIKALIPKETA